jgi:aspartate dehydrogenase
LYDLDSGKAGKLAGALKKPLVVKTLKGAISKSDLLIEAASAKCSYDIAKAALSQGRDIMIMSIGGIVSHFKELSSLAKKHKATVFLPSGAISGIDALKAAGMGRIKKVTLTTRKNPLAFKGVEYVQRKKINLKKIKKDVVLFSGTAKRAVTFFPQNINVAAILSLAGIGADRTRVRIIASPQTKRNIHQIEIESEAGRIVTRTENVLHPDNPKTSYLAVLSALAVLKQMTEPVKIGA